MYLLARVSESYDCFDETVVNCPHSVIESYLAMNQMVLFANRCRVSCNIMQPQQDVIKTIKTIKMIKLPIMSAQMLKCHSSSNGACLACLSCSDPNQPQEL